MRYVEKLYAMLQTIAVSQVEIQKQFSETEVSKGFAERNEAHRQVMQQVLNVGKWIANQQMFNVDEMHDVTDSPQRHNHL